MKIVYLVTERVYDNQTVAVYASATSAREKFDALIKEYEKNEVKMSVDQKLLTAKNILNDIFISLNIAEVMP